MERERINKPAGTWFGATIFSLLTAAAFGGGVFLMVFSSVWHGLFFVAIAIAFARLCWLALPKDHKLQVWVTGLTIALALVYLLYVATHLELHFM
ncbi:hypothetical protein [Massilia rhizosphaerae]|uniref:hypothetical protein n=1 Tax=Massilia rhizosphaerae TaxID=2784389 RepID=UPI0018DC93E1|nr:hypothetical protein [Massilia rhizosphaerae]